ncbi:unnamed protein product [Gordionus sp. m RMFG-2023]
MLSSSVVSVTSQELGDDVLLAIIKYIDLVSLRACLSVNSRWRNIVKLYLRNGKNWKQICFNYLSSLDIVEEITGIHFSHDAKGDNESRLKYWKGIYKTISSGQLFNDNVTKHVVNISSTCVEICADKIIYGEYSGALKMIDIDNLPLQPQGKLIGSHNTEILKISLFDKRLFTGFGNMLISYNYLTSISNDGAFKIWSICYKSSNVSFLFQRQFEYNSYINYILTQGNIIIINDSNIMLFEYIAVDNAFIIKYQHNFDVLTSDISDFRQMSLCIYGQGQDNYVIDLFTENLNKIIRKISDLLFAAPPLDDASGRSLNCCNHVVIIIQKPKFYLVITSTTIYLFDSHLVLVDSIEFTKYLTSNVRKNNMYYFMGGSGIIDCQIYGDIIYVLMDGPGKLTHLALSRFTNKKNLLANFVAMFESKMTRKSLKAGEQSEPKVSYQNDYEDGAKNLITPVLLDIPEYPWFYNNTKILFTFHKIIVTCSFRHITYMYKFSD